MFGKIQSFRLLNKPEFTTNVAYVAYLNPKNAILAFKVAVQHSKLGNFSIEWHKSKADSKNKLIINISKQVDQLEQMNLKMDPSVRRQL